MNIYHICEEIGKTKLSVVYKGRIKKSMQYVAIKSSDKSEKQKIANEMRISQSFEHENLLKISNCYETPNHLWTVAEYCPGGDLLSIIEQDKYLPEQTVRSLGSHLREGLLHLHTHGVVYADIKPSNILCTEFGVLKFADFGLARLITDIDPDRDGKKGTPYYMAPELFEDEGVYSYYSDIWGLGCVLYELATGSPPFVSDNFYELVRMIFEEDVQPVGEFSYDFNKLIREMLQKDPADRISWEEIIGHSFWEDCRFRKINLPPHRAYEEYLSHRGATQRKYQEKRESDVEIVRISQSAHRNLFRESLKESYQNMSLDTNFTIKNKDQLCDLTRKTIQEPEVVQEEEVVAVFHQRSHSEAHKVQTNRPSFVPIPLNELIVHTTEILVEPIIGNVESEVVNSLENIEPWPISQIIDQEDSPELELHLSEVYSLIQQQPRLNLLDYIQSFIISAEIANKLINSAFVQLFLNILTATYPPSVKERILTIIGQMLRHATFIDTEITTSGLTDCLCSLLSDPALGIRTKAMAALGEYLYYASTQMDEEEPPPEWDIPEHLIELVLTQIDGEEDIAVYAVKTIENISAQSQRAGALLENVDTVTTLGHCLRNQPSLRHSAAAALSHLVRRNPRFFDSRVSSVFLMTNFLKLLGEDDQKIQQHCLTMLVLATKHQEIIEATPELLQVLMDLLENQGILIRGKTLLALTFLIKENQKVTVELAQTKFINILEKLTKDCYHYVQYSLYYLLEALADSTIELTQRALSDDFSGVPGILMVVGSAVARFKLSYRTFIDQISGLLSSCRDSEKSKVLEIAEKLSTDHTSLKEHSETVIKNLLPYLLPTSTMNAELRYGSLKIFTDIILVFFSEEEIFHFKKNNITTLLMNDLLSKKFPSFCAFLMDNEMISLCALKLLNAIIENSPNFAVSLRTNGGLQSILALFSPESSKLNKFVFTVIKNIIESKLVQFDSLYELGFVSKLNRVLQHTIQERYREEGLEILYAVLFNFASVAKARPPPESYDLLNNFALVAELTRDKDPVISEKAAHCLLLMLQLYSERICTNYSNEFEQSILLVLNTDKPSMQRKALKLLKMFGKNQVNLKEYEPTLVKLQTHYDAEIQFQASSMLEVIHKSY